MLFTNTALEALPHLQPAARAVQATHPELQIAVALTSKGWIVSLQAGRSLPLARVLLPSAVRADAFLARLAATCGRAAPQHPGRRRVVPAVNSRGAVAAVGDAFFYLDERRPNRSRQPE